MSQLFNTNSIIPENIKLLRRINGMSQAAVAELASLSRPCYCSYECGNKLPSLETIYRLSRIYGVSLDFIITFDISKFIVSTLSSGVHDTSPACFAEKYILLSAGGKLRLKNRIDILLDQEKEKQKIMKKKEP